MRQQDIESAISETVEQPRLAVRVTSMRHEGIEGALQVAIRHPGAELRIRMECLAQGSDVCLAALTIAGPLERGQQHGRSDEFFWYPG